VPAQVTAVEPAFGELANSQEAAAYVETFNRQMLQRPLRLWAVSIPVRLEEVGTMFPLRHVSSPTPTA